MKMQYCAKDLSHRSFLYNLLGKCEVDSMILLKSVQDRGEHESQCFIKPPLFFNTLKNHLCEDDPTLLQQSCSGEANP